MNDRLVVRVLQPVARLSEHAGDNAQPRARLARERRDEVLPRHALEVLHHEVEDAVVLPELVHLAHVRVREPRGEPSLVEELIDERPVRREVRENALDRDELREPTNTVEPREIELRHSAAPELAQHLVPPDALGSVHAPGRVPDQPSTSTSAFGPSAILVAPPPGARWSRRGPARP